MLFPLSYILLQERKFRCYIWHFLEQDLISILGRKELKLESRIDLLTVSLLNLLGHLGCLSRSALPTQSFKYFLRKVFLLLNTCSQFIIKTSDLLLFTLHTCLFLHTYSKIWPSKGHTAKWSYTRIDSKIICKIQEINVHHASGTLCFPKATQGLSSSVSHGLWHSKGSEWHFVPTPTSWMKLP